MSLKQSKSLKLRSQSTLKPDQVRAIERLVQSNTFLDGKPGAGKTIVGASAIAQLLDAKTLKRVLIVTTPKIAKTVWRQEFAAWEHTAHINVAAATGERFDRLGIMTDLRYQVVVISFNILPWVKDLGLFEHFDGLLVDESTKLKTSGGAHFKAIRGALKHFKWRTAMTGTPVSEDFLGLWTQLYLVGLDAPLGTSFTKYKEKYFYPTDFYQRNWELKCGASLEIMERVKPYVYKMAKYEHELPTCHFIRHRLELPENVRAVYDELEKKKVLKAHNVVPPNAAALSQKLQQLAGGFVYNEDEVLEFSDFRAKAVANFLNETNENVLVVYNYQHELALLKEHIDYGLEFDPARVQETVEAWNSGAVRVLFIHPKSAGHGLQLEQGGNVVVWASPQFSRDQWQQVNARLHRRGQTKEVFINTFYAADTVEERVMSTVEYKKVFESMFEEGFES